MKRLLPLLILLGAAAYIGIALRPAHNETAFDLVGFSRLPVLANGRIKPFDTIARSFRFLQESWIEWFVPNGLILAGAWYAWSQGWYRSLPGGVIGFGVIGGVLLHVVMVFRGFLFQLLDGSTHRQRMFKFKNSI